MAVAIAEAAAAGDPLAIECFDLYQDRLARSLASIINVLDPDAIVLGGGLSNLTCLPGSARASQVLHPFR
jgi:fructokinase